MYAAGLRLHAANQKLQIVELQYSLQNYSLNANYMLKYQYQYSQQNDFERCQI